MSIETISTNAYLTYQLAEDYFSVNVGKVVEIVEVPKITKVPQSPDYMSGVINLRGSVLPVVDTRIKFGFPSKENDLNTCIVVLEITINETDQILVGALVDKVLDVLEIEPEKINPSPSLGSKYKSEFIIGMGEIGDGDFIMILDIDKVFSTEELSILTETK